MYPHRIHLHGPWERAGDGGKLVLPAGEFVRFEAAGPVHVRRPFRWPTPLMPFERLWLVASSNLPTQFTLNEQPLGRQDDPWLAFEQDITPLVRPSNQLGVSIEAVGDGIF